MAVGRTITKPQGGMLQIDWPSLSGGEVGDMAEGFSWSGPGTVQVTGTFGTSSVTIQGSNDGSNWFTLTDTLGTALGTLLVALLKGVRENPRFIRPSVSAGTGSGLRVVFIGSTRP